jgi:hypothetical protein
MTKINDWVVNIIETDRITVMTLKGSEGKVEMFKVVPLTFTEFGILIESINKENKQVNGKECISEMLEN